MNSTLKKSKLTYSTNRRHMRYLSLALFSTAIASLFTFGMITRRDVLGPATQARIQYRY